MNAFIRYPRDFRQDYRIGKIRWRSSAYRGRKHDSRAWPLASHQKILRLPFLVFHPRFPVCGWSLAGIREVRLPHAIRASLNIQVMYL